MFSLSASPPPPTLPSFPTRRSSDLPSPPVPVSASTKSRRSLDKAAWARCIAPVIQNSIGTSPSRFCRPGLRPTSFVSRSEEHTSELQSLTNLVCRLLLEKKNKQQNI